MQTLKKVSYILNSRQKRNFCFLLILIFIGSLFELMGVSGVFPLVNMIMDPEVMQNNKLYLFIQNFFGLRDNKQMILFFMILLIVIYVFKNIFLIFMYKLQYRFTYNNQRRIADRLMRCYMKQDYLFHLSKNTADLQRNVTSDVQMFFTTVLNVLQMITEIVVCILLLGYLLYIDINFTLSIAILMLFFVGIFYCLYKKKVVKLGVKYREYTANLYRWINQSFGGIKEIKVLNREEFFLKHFSVNAEGQADAQKDQMLMSIISKPVMETICICGLLFIMMIKVMLGADLNQFIPTLSVFAIAAFRMLPSFNRITGYLSVIMYNKSSVDSVFKDIKEIEDLEKNSEDIIINGELLISDFEKEIHIQNLTFSYPGGERKILDQINIDIPKSKSIALIGPSGAGKTTLADIILGVLKPQAGGVFIDNININDCMNGWHKQIGYIPQNIYLMDDSIRHNIAFGIEDAEINENRIQTVLKEAQLDEFVDALEKGVDTIIGEQGVRLSGGQRQRIGIARAIYGNPEILILDEATSALDNDTEKAVMEAIDKFKGEKTMIIIAHRLTTIKNCDEIFEIDNGKATKKNHADVIKTESCETSNE